jgi:uncharacterized protein with GYD domain
MAQYLIISTFKPADGRRESSADLQQRSDAVSKELKSQAPGAKFGDSYALMDSYQTIDFVEADSEADVEKAAEVIRSHGRVQTLVTPVMAWGDLLTRMKQPADH